MTDLPKPCFSMESCLFPMPEEEIGELTAKMKEFLWIVELVRPFWFITNALCWCGLGWSMRDCEKIFRAFFLKPVYDFPTTKMLIENLKTTLSLRRLCGWKYHRDVPSKATFSRAFKIFPKRIFAQQSASRSCGKIIVINWLVM